MVCWCWCLHPPIPVSAPGPKVDQSGVHRTASPSPRRQVLVPRAGSLLVCCRPAAFAPLCPLHVARCMPLLRSARPRIPHLFVPRWSRVACPVSDPKSKLNTHRRRRRRLGCWNLFSGVPISPVHQCPLCANAVQAEFARLAHEWIEHGAQVVGGCCRIGHAEIKALSDAYPRVQGARA